MNKKVQAWVFGLGLLIILILPVFFEYNAKKRIDVVSYDDYENLFNSANFAVVYFGNTNVESFSKTKTTLAAVKKEFDTNVFAVDYSTLSADNLAKIQNAFSASEAYVFIKDREIVYVAEGEVTAQELETMVNKYYNGIIPQEEIAYKTMETYDDFISLVNNKNTNMFVFGRDNCPYCNKFKPVYNEVAANYNLDIYYINVLTINSTEYNKIINSGLKIPAECNRSNQVEPLSNMDGVPLTLYTKNGKVVGCIGGYVSEDVLITKLKAVGMIK